MPYNKCYQTRFGPRNSKVNKGINIFKKFSGRGLNIIKVKNAGASTGLRGKLAGGDHIIILYNFQMFC